MVFWTTHLKISRRRYFWVSSFCVFPQNSENFSLLHKTLDNIIVLLRTCLCFWKADEKMFRPKDSKHFENEFLSSFHLKFVKLPHYILEQPRVRGTEARAERLFPAGRIDTLSQQIAGFIPSTELRRRRKILQLTSQAQWQVRCNVNKQDACKCKF
jgi:hypothetical protein